MIATTAVAATTPQGAADKTKESGFNRLGKDDFLNLLIQQVQHQDPLNPMDSQDFTAQLAQFSQLEQLTKMNESFDELMRYQASINNAQAISLIGKDIQVKGDTVTLKEEGGPIKLSYGLEKDAASVMLYVKDERGNQVASLVGGAQKAGFNEMTWNGKDADGNKLPAGTYTFQVVAKDIDGNIINASTFVLGRVKGVEFVDGNPYLTTDFGKYALKDVVAVREGEEAEGGDSEPPQDAPPTGETDENGLPQGGEEG